MAGSKGMRKNGKRDKKHKDEGEPELSKELEIAPLKPPAPPKIITSSIEGGIQLQTNLPPEIALATLPYISSDERKMLIGEMAKENERMFESFKLQLGTINKESIINKVCGGLIIILAVAISIYLLATGHIELFRELINIAVIFGGGGGTTVYILYKKGVFAHKDD